LQPAVVSSHEESELQRMLADLELANQELSGDEDSDADSEEEGAGGAGGGKGDEDDERESRGGGWCPGVRSTLAQLPDRPTAPPSCVRDAVDMAKRVGGVGDDELMGLAAAAAAGAGGAGAGAAGAGASART
jgi:hypothetical protein